jgi:hypothetical protein
MKKLKIRKTAYKRITFFVLSLLFISSCDSDISTNSYFTEYGSLLWVNNQMPDDVVKKAVKETVENSSVIIAQVPWAPSDKQFLENIDWYNTLAIQHGKELMINIDWLSNNRKTTRNSDWSFEDDTIKHQFSININSLVDKYKPKFLMLGVEVNYYAFISPDGYKGFVTTFNSLKNSLKEKYPNMRIGLSFQLELLYGIDKDWAQNKSLAPLDAIVENLDFIGISTYPDLITNNEEINITSVSNLDSLFALYDVPIGISETGISSSNFNLNQRSLYIKNIFSKSDQLLFIIWGSMVDGHKNNNWMTRIGLLDYNALPKEEYKEWLEGINNLK